MRLDKYVSLALFVTRSEAKKLISNKDIKVIKDNIEVIKVNSNYNITNEKVYYNNQLIIAKEYIYIMMNKPKDYICANHDNYHKCVFDLIKEYKTRNPGIIGRLDIDTEGLIIITDDGELIHNITSPKHNHTKKYYLETDKSFNEKDILAFNEGVDIFVEKELYHTLPSKLEIIDNNKAYITITEGKFHQIKLMCKAINKNVTYLKRIEINGIKLDDKLKLGECRLLTDEEIDIIKE